MIKIDEPVILFRINQAYRKTMSEELLYNYTRGQWRLSKKNAEKADFGMAVYKGEIIEVYKILRWEKAGTTMNRNNKLIRRKPNERISNRYEFIGELAPNQIREKYIGRSVKHLFKQGNSNPVMYINIHK